MKHQSFVPEALHAALDEIVVAWDGVSRAPLFGHPAYKTHGGVFAFLAPGGVAVGDYSDDERDEMRAAGYAAFTYGEGHVMERWLIVPLRDADDLDEVLTRVRRSYELRRERG
jgi:hypothetical protein